MEIIAEKTQDKQMYDQREKAQLDYEWAMSRARAEGVLAGKEEGWAEGWVQGWVEGWAEGRAEGIEEGEIIGRIRMLQDLLGETAAKTEFLAELDEAARNALLADLQRRFQERRA
ncbi:MAG: hypothetical protein AAF958_16315 [Planctomycetota bacterium]